MGPDEMCSAQDLRGAKVTICFRASPAMDYHTCHNVSLHAKRIFNWLVKAAFQPLCTSSDTKRLKWTEKVGPINENKSRWNFILDNFILAKMWIFIKFHRDIFPLPSKMWKSLVFACFIANLPLLSNGSKIFFKIESKWILHFLPQNKYTFSEKNLFSSEKSVNSFRKAYLCISILFLFRQNFNRSQWLSECFRRWSKGWENLDSVMKCKHTHIASIFNFMVKFLHTSFLKDKIVDPC